ncbi:MAG TPA: type II secretion system F family protein [Magnetospirillum sp.]|jgi:tight adherence protein C|nr:type II secretion system F family protein [Magnetospirillum sp.]
MTADFLETLALLTLLAVAALVALRLNRPGARAADRAREIVREAGGAPRVEDESPDLSAKPGLLAELGNKLPLFNPKQRRALQNLLLTGGFRQPHALSVFITLKIIGGAVGAVLGTVASHMADTATMVAALMVLGGLQVGMTLPELALRRRVRKRQRQIYRSVPDALDLLVICTNAGYSLGASIKRIGAEIESVCPPLANELEITAHEIQMNADPVVGLRHLAERTGVECLRSLVATLIQAHQYGTPITQSLKTLARTERTTRILLLEEKGAKLAAKMTMPMMVLILPAVMLISGGPAFLRMMEAFHK